MADPQPPPYQTTTGRSTPCPALPALETVSNDRHSILSSSRMQPPSPTLADFFFRFDFVKDFTKAMKEAGLGERPPRFTVAHEGQALRLLAEITALHGRICKILRRHGIAACFSNFDELAMPRLVNESATLPRHTLVPLGPLIRFKMWLERPRWVLVDRRRVRLALDELYLLTTGLQALVTEGRAAARGSRPASLQRTLAAESAWSYFILIAAQARLPSSQPPRIYLEPWIVRKSGQARTPSTFT